MGQNVTTFQYPTHQDASPFRRLHTGVPTMNFDAFTFSGSGELITDHCAH
jgi:hypothetical protein